MTAGLALTIDDVAELRVRTSATEVQAAVRGDARSPRDEFRNPGFVDRQAEAELMFEGLRSSMGPHFWLVVAPPGLGKSSFLNYMWTRFKAQDPGWEVRAANVRDLVEPQSREPASLVARFFGPELDNSADHDVAGQVAKVIAADGRSYLCLLDSAELLNEHVVVRIRKYFSDIYQLTGAWASDQGIGRVALVVASQLDAGWMGTVPTPGFLPMPLTALTRDDIRESLRELAVNTGSDFGYQEHERVSAHLGELSAGVPELLATCLGWIEESRWANLERLAEENIFQELGHPYVRDRLLSSSSLLPLTASDPGGKRRQVVEEALRLLIPYRLFTQSHLRQHLRHGSRLSSHLFSVDWSAEDLWNAISNSALIDRGRHDPWLTVQPAIRRLLFRYFYPTGHERAQAQRIALAFTQIWSQGQEGNNQVAGLAECMWHEAALVRISEPTHLETKVRQSAIATAARLRPTEYYSVNELKQLLAERLEVDAELRELLGNAIAAYGSLANIVTSSQEPL